MFQSIWYGMGRILVLIIAGIVLKLDVFWKGKLPDGPVIIAANHPSTTDPALITTLVPEQTTILIKDTLFKIPLFGKSLRMSGHIPVIEGQGKAALEQAEKLLRKGRTVVVFPEGEISPVEGGFHKPHTGLARLALATGAPVIPVGISIDRDCMQLIETNVEGKKELGTWYFHGPYAMTVGEALYFHGNPEDRAQVQYILEKVMHQIATLSNESAYRLMDAQYAATIPVKIVNFGLRLVLTV